MKRVATSDGEQWRRRPSANGKRATSRAVDGCPGGAPTQPGGRTGGTTSGVVVPLGRTLWSALDLPAPPLAAGLIMVLVVAGVSGALGGARSPGGPAVRVVGVELEYRGVEATAANVIVANRRDDPLLAAVTTTLHAGTEEPVAAGRSRTRLGPALTTVTVRFDAPVSVGRFESVYVRVIPGVRPRATDAPRTP